MPNPHYRIRFSGPVSRGVVGWIARLIPVLRDAPAGSQITVQIDYGDEQDEDARGSET